MAKPACLRHLGIALVAIIVSFLPFFGYADNSQAQNYSLIHSQGMAALARLQFLNGLSKTDPLNISPKELREKVLLALAANQQVIEYTEHEKLTPSELAKLVSIEKRIAGSLSDKMFIALTDYNDTKDHKAKLRAEAFWAAFENYLMGRAKQVATAHEFQDIQPGTRRRKRVGAIMAIAARDRAFYFNLNILYKFFIQFDHRSIELDKTNGFYHFISVGCAAGVLASGYLSCYTHDPTAAAVLAPFLGVVYTGYTYSQSNAQRPAYGFLYKKRSYFFSQIIPVNKVAEFKSLGGNCAALLNTQ